MIIRKEKVYTSTFTSDNIIICYYIYKHFTLELRLCIKFTTINYRTTTDSKIQGSITELEIKKKTKDGLRQMLRQFNVRRLHRGRTTTKKKQKH